jgi:hypothetical protein
MAFPDLPAIDFARFFPLCISCNELVEEFQCGVYILCSFNCPMFVDSVLAGCQLRTL